MLCQDIMNMEVDPLGVNGSFETQASTSTAFNLVGGPFAVIESDPGWLFIDFKHSLTTESWIHNLRSFHFINSSTWNPWPRIG